MRPFRRPYLLLTLIVMIGSLLRWLFVDLCPIYDRGTIAIGMINNLPPLYHYLSVPFFHITDNIWFAPAIPNIIMSAIAIVLLYFMGSDLVNQKLGLILAFVFAISPAAILNARYVSPEMTELFFIILICFFFIRIEVLEKKNLRMFNLVMLSLSVMIGAFSKQQTLLILIPLFIYGLYKHRLGIFSRPAYYVMPIAALPYLLFLLSNPQLLGSILVYFTKQPSTASVSIQSRLATLMAKHIVFSVMYLLLIGWASFRWKKIMKAAGKDAIAFILILLVTYHLFFLKIDAYYHLIILPIVLICGLLIYTLESYAKAAVISLLIIGTVVGQAMLVPGISQATITFCEEEIIGPTILHELTGFVTEGSTYIRTKTEFIDAIAGDSRYIIIGGDVGQEWKYWLKQRIYYPSVMNQERFDEIDHAILVTSASKSLETTYTDSPSWDAPYVAALLNNSRVISVDEEGGRYVYFLKIENHDIDLPEMTDFRTRARQSLALTDARNQS
jgi:hypothetical protein